MAKHEAIYVPITCGKTKEKYYIEYDYSYDGVWVAVRGVKKLPEGKQQEGSDRAERIQMNKTRMGPQYKCPYCGNTSFVICGRCGDLNCHDGKSRTHTCAKCNQSSRITGTIQSLDGKKRKAQL